MATHRDCVAGSGNDTIVLPRNSQQTISSSHGSRLSLGTRGCNRGYYGDPSKHVAALPLITSAIVIEGRGSTISSLDQQWDAAFIVERAGDLLLNDTTITRMGGLVNLGALNTAGSVISDGRFGCGLYNVGGSALLSDTTISGFHEPYQTNYFHGVGIDNLDGRVELVRSAIRSNRGYEAGIGGIYNGAKGTIVLRNSVVSGNWSMGNHASATGGIMNLGALRADNSTIANNSSGYDIGGLDNDGTAVLVDVRIDSNSAGVHNSGTISLTRCTINNNRNGYSAGLSNTGHARLVDSSVTGNVSSGYWGSAVTNGPRGTLLISGSTISANSSYAGGGILNFGDADVRNSTISGNEGHGSGYYDGLPQGVGGGIMNRGGNLTLANSRITGNKSKTAGGLFNDGVVTITRSIIAGNLVDAGAREIENRGGTVVVNGFNLFGSSNSSCVKNVTLGRTDIVPTKPLSGILVPLAHNSSKTKTHALAINSPALNASPADAGCPAKDQRGAPRPSGTKCDIGAFEGSAVMCNGVVTTHVGTAGNDVIYGTPGHDVIAGLSGNDTLQGLDGDDMICGGNGKDGLIGGRGIDTLLGEAGDDVLRGQAGDDIVNGGIGTDTCDGGTNGAAGDVAAQCEQVTNVP